MAESEEELKSLLMKVKVESEKVGSKLNIQKTKIMASGLITSWEIDGETVETGSDFIFLGSKITTDGDCSHEIKRRLLLGRKVMTNLDSIFKSKDITLPTKVHLVKAMVFPVVMYGCESWTVKKAERRRIDAFELCCWRRLLRVPWTARRSNQSILKEISPGISSEGMMLKLKLQDFGHLMWRGDSLEKTLMLGGIGGRRRRGRQRMLRWLDGITDSMDLGPSELRELVMDREAWRAAIHGFEKSRTWLSDNWTELDSMNKNLSKLWEIQGSQRLGLNNTFLFCSPLTLEILLFSKLLSLPTRNLQEFLFHVSVSLQVPHQFSFIDSSSGFFQFSISLKVDVFASHDTPPHPTPTIYGNGSWIRSPPPARAKFQLVEIRMKEPGGQVAGPGHPPWHRVIMKTRPQEIWALGGSGSQEQGVLPRSLGLGRGRGLQGPRQRGWGPRSVNTHLMEENFMRCRKCNGDSKWF